MWDAKGCSNLKQLHRLVGTNLLHLTKEKCLSDLPPLTRETRKVPISSRNQIQYTQAIKDLVRNWMWRQLRSCLGERVWRPSCSKSQPLGIAHSPLSLSRTQEQIDLRSRQNSDKDEAVLGAMQRLRVICAHAKIGATVELAKRILEDGPAVVIFSNFAEVARKVQEQLGALGWEGELLTGKTPPKKRQGMVDNFQVSGVMAAIALLHRPEDI